MRSFRGGTHLPWSWKKINFFEQNHVISDEIWPPIEEDAPWESLSIEYSKTLKEDKQI